MKYQNLFQQNRLINKMAKQKLLATMLAYASELHGNQFDKAGKAYFLHCIQVMEYVREKYSNDEELLCIAIGHDLLEDTDALNEDIRFIFGERIYNGILALTKNDEDSEESYIERIIKNKDAIKVKIADLKHNSDITRLKGLRAKDFKRMKKYHRMFIRLNDEIKFIR